jgi:multiple sugar transport system substrate-binding protein
MLKRSIAILFVIVFTISMLFTGCGSGNTAKTDAGTNTDSTTATMTSSVTTAEQSSTTPASNAPVTLKTALYIDNGDVTTDQVKGFEKEHPNITIDNVNMTMDKLMAMFASGTEPDIIRAIGYNEFPTYVTRGLALNLDNYIAKSKIVKVDDMFPIINFFKWDGARLGTGSIYGFVKDWSIDTALMINKKLFAKAGLQVPSTDTPLTWDQAADYAKKLTIIKNGKLEQQGFVINCQTQDAEALNLMLAQQGKSLWSDDFSKININTPESKKILQYLVDNMKAGAFNSPLYQPTDGWGGQLFMEDKVGMLMVGYWYTGMLRSNDQLKNRLDDFAMLPTPVLAEGGQRMSTCLTGTGAFISKNTKHPDEAYQFLEWLMADSMADERAKSGWGQPLYKSKLDLLPQNTNFDKQTLEVLKSELNVYSDKVVYNPYISNVTLNGLFDKYFVPVLYGKGTLDEACANIEKEANTLIAEGKEIAGVN